MGQGSPYFCKLICPAGTLEGGIPLALLNKSMRSALGALYAVSYTHLSARGEETRIRQGEKIGKVNNNQR